MISNQANCNRNSKTIMNDSNRDEAVGGSTDDPYPYYFRGIVVVGFGRGGRKLGCPTANMDDNVILCLPPHFPCGVFYGFANVNRGEVYGMVTSIGWNPHFKNERKTIEVHILHDFQEDFYGAEVRAVLVGFLRPMVAFDSLDELKTAINNDVALAESLLSVPEMMVYKKSNFFSQ
ncbi:Riboflavin kinase family protein [Brugia pahangi]